MNRDEFLGLDDVSGFIEWMIKEIPNTTFFLNFAASKHVPGGLVVKAKGLENVLSHYRWGAHWDDLEGNRIHSLEWKSTRESLATLSAWIQRSVAERDELSAYYACLAILQWGGVRGAKPFLENLHENGGLTSYLAQLEPLFDLTGSQSVLEFDSNKVLRFDSGLTKIHSLLDQSGSPIYDSRVGAAIAMLYAMYVDECKPDGANLRFPSGPARGAQIRNPRMLGYPSAPQFFTPAVPAEVWAQWQLKSGWIIRNLLGQCDWFKAEGDLAERCHCFEAALFMIGYDLRCFVTESEPAI